MVHLVFANLEQLFGHVQEEQNAVALFVGCLVAEGLDEVYLADDLAAVVDDLSEHLNRIGQLLVVHLGAEELYRLFLDLADALSREVVVFADCLERLRRKSEQTETFCQNGTVALLEVAQYFSSSRNRLKALEGCVLLVTNNLVQDTLGNFPVCFVLLCVFHRSNKSISEPI